MTMASRYQPWCNITQDDRQAAALSSLNPFLPGSNGALYPGQPFPGFNLRTPFPHPGFQSPHHQQLYGFPNPGMPPAFPYPDSHVVHDANPDQTQRRAGTKLRPGDDDADLDCGYSDVGSNAGDASTVGDDIDVDGDDEYSSFDVSNHSNTRHSPASESATYDDEVSTTNNRHSPDHSNAPSKYPDYCRTLTVKDASGHIKELVFPKALDLDRPKRARTTFSPDQLVTLEREFLKNQYLVGRERTDLAQRLGLSETQVKVWFQNRRTKYKRDKCREADEEKVRAESSAACNILRILQDRRGPPNVSQANSVGLSTGISQSNSLIPGVPHASNGGLGVPHAANGALVSRGLPGAHSPPSGGMFPHASLGMGLPGHATMTMGMQPPGVTPSARNTHQIAPVSGTLTSNSRNGHQMSPAINNTGSAMLPGMGHNIAFLT